MRARQRNLLPALLAEAHIPLHKFPNYNLLVLEKPSAAAQFLAHQRGSAAIVDHRRQRTAQFFREVRDETGRARRVFLVDPQKAVAKNEYLRLCKMPLYAT